MTDIENTATTHAVLVPGFWLGGWAWDEVASALQRTGIVAHAVTLPGLDPDDPVDGEVTLDDHVAAVAGLVDGLDGDVVLVGHSGGGAVVQGVLDRHPGGIRRAVYVDTGPLLDGTPPVGRRRFRRCPPSVVGAARSRGHQSSGSGRRDPGAVPDPGGRPPWRRDPIGNARGWTCRRRSFAPASHRPY